MDIGRRKDLTVIWALAVDLRMFTSLGLIEIKNTSFREQFDVLSQVLSCPRVRRCAIDASGLGMELAENAVRDFGDHKVEACTLSGPFKEQAGSIMRNKFADKLVRIPVDERIRNDLHSVRKIVTNAGNVRLEAPREEGSHADRFWALALACYAGSAPMGRIECTLGPERPMSGAREI
jgi:phage FluMu gp28-like protein